MKRTTFLLTTLLLLCAAQAQQWYAGAALAAGNGPDLGSSYASVEFGRMFGPVAAGVAVGRDLAVHDSKNLYFVEVRGTHVLNLFDGGAQPYVCGGLGQYLDGRWVNEFGAGLCWPSGIAVGACGFGGFGYLTFGWTGVFGKKEGK